MLKQYCRTVAYLSFHPMVKRICLRSKAWLAASVRLRLTRLPPTTNCQQARLPASRVRRSCRLRDTLAAAPGLLARASVTETVKLCPMGPKLSVPQSHKCTEVKRLRVRRTSAGPAAVDSTPSTKPHTCPPSGSLCQNLHHCMGNTGKRMKKH